MTWENLFIEKSMLEAEQEVQSQEEYCELSFIRFVNLD